MSVVVVGRTIGSPLNNKYSVLSSPSKLQHTRDIAGLIYCLEFKYQYRIKLVLIIKCTYFSGFKIVLFEPFVPGRLGHLYRSQYTSFRSIYHRVDLIQRP